MSAELDIAVFTLAQFNRDSVISNRKGSKVLRSEGVSEAAAIAHVSETIITLNKSAEDDENNRFVACLDKARDARAGLLVECNTNMRCMKMFDPMLGMQNKGYDLPDKKVQDEDDE